jgi:hypothetical protein
MDLKLKKYLIELMDTVFKLHIEMEFIKLSRFSSKISICDNNGENYLNFSKEVQFKQCTQWEKK